MVRIRYSGSLSPTWSAIIRVMFGLLALLLAANPAAAKPTTADQARSVVQHWLAREAAPMGCILGGEIKGVQTFNDDSGAPAYFVVYLNPGGLVFLPAEDLVEPIIAFAGGAISYDPSPANPLATLVSRDIAGRIIQARKVESERKATRIPLASGDLFAKAQRKWASLAAGATDSGASGPESVPSVSDVRVTPIIQSTWTQGLNDGSLPTNPSASGVACFNYNTPPDGYTADSGTYSGYDSTVYYNGSGYNYVCGCVATAMAQFMRHFQYPAAPPAGLNINFNIKIDGTAYPDNFWGGSLSGSAYNWSNMPLDVRSGATDAQCQEIGSLCADAGCAVNMSYTQGGSSATPGVAAYALVHYFNYSNAIAGVAGSTTNNNMPNAIRDTMLNSNLDAGLPCLLGIYNNGTNGHDVVCDGYGYNSSTLYNHLNFGWKNETVNVWYNLPNIGTSDGYDTVGTVVYNIYITGSGEIISGRVTSNSSTPLSGVAVTATGPGGPYTATTNSNGIYALPYVHSNSTYTISASRSGYSFPSQKVVTGTSVNSVSAPSSPGGNPVVNKSQECGNIWGINFNSGSPGLTLNEALDNKSLTFTTGGDNSWFPETTTSIYGGSAAQSGAIAAGQYTWLKTNTIQGPGILSFYWKVDSEADYDYLDLWIDKTDTDSITGSVGWTKGTYLIPPGVHTISWVYSKDPNSTGAGSDCGWVDKVVYYRGGLSAVYQLLLTN